MKKNQVNAILVDQAKRKKKIINYSCLIFLVTIIALAFFCVFLLKNKTYYVPYKEESNIDYKVYLKQNEFFNQNFLESNNQYIASLIANINANFNYKLKVEDKDIDYKYQYYIDASVNVKDKDTNKSIYNFKENLVNNKLYYSNNKSEVDIKENVLIDYNKYNDLIKRFVSAYSLDEAIATLNINMYVKVLGECEDVKDSDKNSVVSLSIPLTTKTVAIDIEKNLIDTNKENFMACKTPSSFNIVYLIISIIIFIVDIVLLISLTKYIIDTRTAETIYQKELKKILNNYKSYIQKINTAFDLTGYQSLIVDTFTDMLEIRDTLQQPILMVENKENTGVYFIIPSNTKILYMYSLKVSEIKKQMIENGVERGIVD